MAALEYAVSEHIATITLNRPERMNTISREMLDELCVVLTRANEDADVRVIVLTGTGRAFCAGLDLNEAASGEGIGGSGNRFAARWICATPRPPCCTPSTSR